MRFNVTIEQDQEGGYGSDNRIATGMTWTWEVRSDDYQGFMFKGCAVYEAQAREDVATCIKGLMDRVQYKLPQTEAVERIAKAQAEASSRQFGEMYKKAQDAEKRANEANERLALIEAAALSKVSEPTIAEEPKEESTEG